MSASNPRSFPADFELFVFDLDGTLVDSSLDIAISVNHALRSLGLREWSLPEVKGFIGNGTKVLMQRAVAERAERFDEAFDLFTRHYAEHLLDHTRTYPGTFEVLASLSHVRRAILSNKRQRFCDPIVDGLGLRPHVDLVLGGDILPVHKPDPEPLRWVCERLSVDPSRSVMIGDSPIDVRTGRAAGAYTIGLTGGFCPAPDVLSAGPDLTLPGIAGLAGHLTRNSRRHEGRIGDKA